MNIITHKVITIEYDIWEPFLKITRDEEDRLLWDLKDKLHLKHAGNVKATLREI